jgi:hypothetical protein
LSPEGTGDAFVAAARMVSSTDSVASISGGGATWTSLTSFHDVSDNQDLELWLGTISDTDPAPVIVTPQLSDVATDIVVQEFRDAVTTPTTIVAPNTTATRTTPTTIVAPTTSNSTAVVPTSTPHRPSVPRLSSAHITGAQAWVKWTDSEGRVTKVSAAVFASANSKVVVRTQVVPNSVDSVADGEIHFSRARGGVAKAGSFSPSTTYFVHVISVVGPGRTSAESRCLTLGRG